MNKSGVFVEYNTIIKNADRGLALLKNETDNNKFVSYYFQKGYAYKVQLEQDSALKYLGASILYASYAKAIDLEVKAITQINYFLRFFG